MGQYFLASVGNAEAFAKKDNKLVHFFSAKTLTDSSISISVSGEEVRGGQGAQLLGQFFHTSVFGLQMTDTMFKLEYLQAQVGGKIEKGGIGLVDESVTTIAGGQVTLTGTPAEILPGAGTVVWYNRPGETEYATATVEGQTFTIPGESEGSAYCVHYYANKEDARTLFVSAEFIPEELVVLLTTRLYAGDASAPETGRPVGSVTVKIPRFQLNGTADLAMNMSSAATISLEGTALAYGADCEGAQYAEIIEFLNGSIYDGYEKLVIENADDLHVGDVPVVYAVGTKKIPMLVDNAEITFTPALSDGAIATGADASGLDAALTVNPAIKAAHATVSPAA